MLVDATNIGNAVTESILIIERGETNVLHQTISSTKIMLALQF